MSLLEGIKIVEVAEGMCAPQATMHFGDMGADIIKVEPIAGDYARGYPPFVGETSAIFATINRNKRSICVDLKQADGVEIVRKLAEKADILLEELGPGQAEKLGLKYDALQKANPGLIYGAVSAYGEQGPLAEQPGAEFVIQAFADYCGSFGRLKDAPERMGADVANGNTALCMFQGLMAAMFQRKFTGEGQKVACSMLGTLMYMRATMWAAQSNGIDDWFGFHVQAYTNAPNTGYRSKDGQVYFSLGRGNVEDFDNVMMQLDMLDVMDDPRYANFGREAIGTGRYASECAERWEKAFADKTTDEIRAIINKNHGTAVPILNYEGITKHPQTAVLNIVTDLPLPDGKSMKAISPVWHFGDTSHPRAQWIAAPQAGADTDAILKELGYTAARIKQLKAKGAVK